MRTEDENTGLGFSSSNDQLFKPSYPCLVNHCLFIYAEVVQPSSGKLSTSWDCDVISHIYAHARFPHERGFNTRKESYNFSEVPQTWLGGSECALWGQKHPMIDQNYLLQRPEEP